MSTLIVTLITFSCCVAQVNVSETFQNTLKKIGKERIKKEVIAWVTEQDVISGIVARDLIAQVLDGKDQETLLRSTTNVVTTMLFLGGIKNHVEQLANENPEVIDAAKSAGWNRQQLIGYSCLYYYFSERMKYKLYVSPEILKMSEEKSLIESLRSKTDRKWTIMVSQALVKARRDNGDVNVDVRLLEFVDKSLWNLLSDREKYFATVESDFKSLLNMYAKERALGDAIVAMTDTVNGALHTDRIFDLYINRFSTSYKIDNAFSLALTLESKTSATIAAVDSATRSATSNVLVMTFSSLVSTARLSFVDQAQYKAILVGILKELLDRWMNQAKQNGWRVDYAVSLSATGLHQASQTNMDFTVLDQIRFVNYYETTRVFVYLGGFLDPILKNTVNKDGAKVYLSGVGFGWGPAYIAVSAGIEYPNVVLKNTRFGISFGYEIPVTDLLE